MKREKIIRYIIILLMIILLSLTYGIKYLNKSKYEELPEVKLKEKIKKEKTFAIMVSDDGSNYQKYESNEWPNDKYKFKEAKCIDNKGNLIDGVITFENGKASIKTDRTIYCTLYFDHKETIEILRETDLNENISSNLQGGMYRYQASFEESDSSEMTNWIIFGTREKCEKDEEGKCKNLENMTYADYVDKYMYRIIGINQNGELYLIKETFLKEGSVNGFSWNDEYRIDSGVDLCPSGKCPEWNEADLFKRINGIANGTKTGNGNANDGVDNDTDIFVDNEYYDYLRSGDKSNGGETPSEWYNLIVDHEWMYGDIIINSYNGETLYGIETGQTETTHYVQNPEGSTIVETQNYKWPETNKITAKISLMYLHDVAYAYPGGNPGDSTNVKNSWIHFQKDGYNTRPNYEWLSTRWGIFYTDSAEVGSRFVDYTGILRYRSTTLTDANGVRPVFYLSQNVKIKNGNGTKSNPYLLSF